MNLMDFSAKRVLITGSTMGIGYGAARRSARAARGWPSTAVPPTA